MSHSRFGERIATNQSMDDVPEGDILVVDSGSLILAIIRIESLVPSSSDDSDGYSNMAVNSSLKEKFN